LQVTLDLMTSFEVHLQLILLNVLHL
jgi:hypothetical protein